MIVNTSSVAFVVLAASTAADAKAHSIRALEPGLDDLGDIIGGIFGSADNDGTTAGGVFGGLFDMDSMMSMMCSEQAKGSEPMKSLCAGLECIDLANMSLLDNEGCSCGTVLDMCNGANSLLGGMDGGMMGTMGMVLPEGMMDSMSMCDEVETCCAEPETTTSEDFNDCVANTMAAGGDGLGDTSVNETTVPETDAGTIDFAGLDLDSIMATMCTEEAKANEPMKSLCAGFSCVDMQTLGLKDECSCGVVLDMCNGVNSMMGVNGGGGMLGGMMAMIPGLNPTDMCRTVETCCSNPETTTSDEFNSCTADGLITGGGDDAGAPSEGGLLPGMDMESIMTTMCSDETEANEPMQSLCLGMECIDFQTLGLNDGCKCGAILNMCKVVTTMMGMMGDGADNGGMMGLGMLPEGMNPLSMCSDAETCCPEPETTTSDEFNTCTMDALTLGEDTSEEVPVATESTATETTTADATKTEAPTTTFEEDATTTAAPATTTKDSSESSTAVADTAPTKTTITTIPNTSSASTTTTAAATTTTATDAVETTTAEATATAAAATTTSATTTTNTTSTSSTEGEAPAESPGFEANAARVAEETSSGGMIRPVALFVALSALAFSVVL